jgi:hypothetical protein
MPYNIIFEVLEQGDNDGRFYVGSLSREKRAQIPAFGGAKEPFSLGKDQMGNRGRLDCI